MNSMPQQFKAETLYLERALKAKCTQLEANHVELKQKLKRVKQQEVEWDVSVLETSKFGNGLKAESPKFHLVVRMWNHGSISIQNDIQKPHLAMVHSPLPHLQ